MKVERKQNVKTIMSGKLIGRISNQTVFVERPGFLSIEIKGHLRDGRQVVKRKGEWLYEIY